MRDRRTRIASLVVFAAALACSLTLATVALATTPGDNEASAIWLNDPGNSYMASSITTDLITGSITPTGHFYFRIELSAGDTFNADFVSGPGVINLKSWVAPLQAGYGYVESSTDASGVAHLSFAAPKYGMYSVYTGASSLGTFTVTPRKVAAVAYKLGSMTAGSKQTHKKSFYVAAKLYPKYNGVGVPVKFYIQRKTSGHWKAYASKTGYVSANSASYTKYAAKFNISKAGTYRVRARFADAAHSSAKYNSYKTIYVK